MFLLAEVESGHPMTGHRIRGWVCDAGGSPILLRVLRGERSWEGRASVVSVAVWVGAPLCPGADDDEAFSELAGITERVVD